MEISASGHAAYNSYTDYYSRSATHTDPIIPLKNGNVKVTINTFSPTPLSDLHYLSLTDRQGVIEKNTFITELPESNPIGAFFNASCSYNMQQRNAVDHEFYSTLTTLTLSHDMFKLNLAAIYYAMNHLEYRTDYGNKTFKPTSLELNPEIFDRLIDISTIDCNTNYNNQYKVFPFNYKSAGQILQGVIVFLVDWYKSYAYMLDIEIEQLEEKVKNTEIRDSQHLSYKLRLNLLQYIKENLITKSNTFFTGPKPVGVFMTHLTENMLMPIDQIHNPSEKNKIESILNWYNDHAQGRAYQFGSNFTNRQDMAKPFYRFAKNEYDKDYSCQFQNLIYPTEPEHLSPYYNGNNYGRRLRGIPETIMATENVKYNYIGECYLRFPIDLPTISWRNGFSYITSIQSTLSGNNPATYTIATPKPTLSVDAYAYLENSRHVRDVISGDVLVTGIRELISKFDKQFFLGYSSRQYAIDVDTEISVEAKEFDVELSDDELFITG